MVVIIYGKRGKTMLSKFSHTFKMDDGSYAYYNSLQLQPVYVREEDHFIISSVSANELPSSLPVEVYSELVKNKIIVNSPAEDALLLNRVREKLFTPYPTIMYLILSEKCNLACKYCFLGNANTNIMQHQMPMMEKEIADKALQYFSFQNKTHPEWFGHSKEIIFYGGEPLLNFETLKYVIDRCKEMQINNEITAEMNFSMVTNGLLLDKEKIHFLKENNVAISISIDGIDFESNINRVNKSGNPIYDNLLEVLELVKESEYEVGLSITLTEKTISNPDDIISLLDKYQINAVSFNLLYSTPDFQMSTNYYKKASKFTVDSFKIARIRGIYEDRINRKVEAFVDGTPYLSDCAATSGSQIVVLPDGRIGICQGCIENKEFFFTDVSSRDPLEQSDEMQKWCQISPVNKDECLSCKALGICGGGCPINGMRNSEKSVYDAIDPGFCVHAKTTLDFMVRDLYSIITTNSPILPE